MRGVCPTPRAGTKVDRTGRGEGLESMLRDFDRDGFGDENNRRESKHRQKKSNRGRKSKAKKPQRPDSYVGEMRNSVPHGKGTYLYKNAYFKYTGDWVNGVKQGKGVFHMGDGGFYEGDFHKGEIDGSGLRQWPSGRSYCGQFKRGELHGQGVCIEADGSKYEGGWAANKRWGQGELTSSDGSTYTGRFQGHRQHGDGVMVGGDGERYEGSWHQGLRAGRGKMSAADGSSYTGQWREGQRHGKATQFDAASNVRYEGLFECDQPIFRSVELVMESQGSASNRFGQGPSIKLNPKKLMILKLDVYLVGIHFKADATRLNAASAALGTAEEDQDDEDEMSPQNALVKEKAAKAAVAASEYQSPQKAGKLRYQSAQEAMKANDAEAATISGAADPLEDTETDAVGPNIDKLASYVMDCESGRRFELLIEPVLSRPVASPSSSERAMRRPSMAHQTTGVAQATPQGYAPPVDISVITKGDLGREGDPLFVSVGSANGNTNIVLPGLKALSIADTEPCSDRVPMELKDGYLRIRKIKLSKRMKPGNYKLKIRDTCPGSGITPLIINVTLPESMI